MPSDATSTYTLPRLLFCLLITILAVSGGCARRPRPLPSQMPPEGILDVTRAPYHADPTGQRDSTSALQKAVQDACRQAQVAYLPPGRYRVSDTLLVGAQLHPQQDPPLQSRYDSPCVIWGGTYQGRAEIVLMDRAPGFGDPKRPKPVMRFASWGTHSQAQNLSVSSTQLLISVDFDLGSGNPGAIAVDHQGPQGCAIEDVQVRARDAFAGFRGAYGPGASMSHVSVEGGKYGLYWAASRPVASYRNAQSSSVLSYVTLIDQADAAILVDTQGPLTVAGAWIEGAGVQVQSTASALDGPLSLVDSVLRLRHAKPAIRSNRPVYLQNVYVEGTETIVELPGGIIWRVKKPGWNHVVEFAATGDTRAWLRIDGKPAPSLVVRIQEGAEPPDDLRAVHHWAEKLPSWNAPKVANVKAAPYLAKGDGQSDDTAAIQRALDENRDVFLPKGVYRISQPLRLNRANRLFGLGVYSKIEPLPAGAFAQADSPAPLVATADAADATCALAFVELSCRWPGSYAIHWRAGARSIVRNVRTAVRPWRGPGPSAAHPMIVIEGSGGGRWYNVSAHGKVPQTRGHRFLLARQTSQPLSIYMLNPGHRSADYVVEFDRVRHLRVFGVDAGTSEQGMGQEAGLAWVRDSSHVEILGHWGSASVSAGGSVYRIERSRPFRLVNLANQPRTTPTSRARWFLVSEYPIQGQPIQVPVDQLLLLYERR